MRSIRSLSVLCSILVLAAAARADIDSIAPVQASLGTVLTIDGSGFGSARAKVFLVDPASGKKYATKVTAFGDTQLTVQVKRAVAGLMDVVVQPKGKGLAPFTAPDAVVIEAPVIGAILEQPGGVALTQAEPKQELTLVGSFFGVKKPKVRIGGKPAKVVELVPGGAGAESGKGTDYAVVVMPSSLANGLWTIAFTNKIGVDDSQQVTVINSTVSLGKAHADLTFNGEPVNFKYSPSLANPGSDYFTMFMTSAGVNKTFTITVPFDVVNDVPPQHLVSHPLDPLFSAIYVELDGSYSAGWAASGSTGSLVVDITASAGGRVAGEIHAQLVKTTDTFPTPQVDTIDVEGTFVFEP